MGFFEVVQVRPPPFFLALFFLAPFFLAPSFSPALACPAILRPQLLSLFPANTIALLALPPPPLRARIFAAVRVRCRRRTLAMLRQEYCAPCSPTGQCAASEAEGTGLRLCMS
jgi:hypothetical protein